MSSPLFLFNWLLKIVRERESEWKQIVTMKMARPPKNIKKRHVRHSLLQPNDTKWVLHPVCYLHLNRTSTSYITDTCHVPFSSLWLNSLLLLPLLLHHQPKYKERPCVLCRGISVPIFALLWTYLQPKHPTFPPQSTDHRNREVSATPHVSLLFLLVTSFAIGFS